MPEILRLRKLIPNLVLLVEGKDEKSLFLHLLNVYPSQKRNSDHRFRRQISDQGQHRHGMKRAEIDGVPLTSLAIVRDADDSSQGCSAECAGIR